eukprot:CAMPEP_0182446180 /NCGR_PEP_ID=MMETSP1172-20130603/4038_1 /TAXON_ID=708627 /ORGANISM="Timspurckia oligopyrenoides, Strain CCMP3278" /LENGTH=505 /DNA_ID=CAMNT_0024642071 /DNA_START=229 /DNA_END=1746 /DNA_ORIENTATION=+
MTFALRSFQILISLAAIVVLHSILFSGSGPMVAHESLQPQLLPMNMSSPSNIQQQQQSVSSSFSKIDTQQVVEDAQKNAAAANEALASIMSDIQSGLAVTQKPRKVINIDSVIFAKSSDSKTEPIYPASPSNSTTDKPADGAVLASSSSSSDSAARLGDSNLTLDSGGDSSSAAERLASDVIAALDRFASPFQSASATNTSTGIAASETTENNRSSATDHRTNRPDEAFATPRPDAAFSGDITFDEAMIKEAEKSEASEQKQADGEMDAAEGAVLQGQDDAPSGNSSADTAEGSTEGKKEKFRGVVVGTEGVVGNFNVTKLSFSLFRLMKSKRLFSLIDFPCSSNLDWMPQLVVRLEFEMPGFYYTCMEPEGSRIEEIKRRFQPYVDPDVVVWPLNQQRPMPRSDVVFSWNGVQYWDMRESFNLVRMARLSSKMLMMSTNPKVTNLRLITRNNWIGNGTVNLRKQPFLLDAPIRVVGNLSIPDAPLQILCIWNCTTMKRIFSDKF